MRKHVIWIIISLMSVALVGLTGFQVYWISNALKLNQQQFEQSVQESLQLVAQKLEKRDAYEFARHSMLRYSFPEIFRSETDRGDHIYPDSSQLPSGVREFSSGSMWINITDEANNRRVIRKSDVVNIVVEEMFSRKRNIRERIRPQVVDSMLNNEFTERGIDIDFDFAVWNPRRDSVIFTNATSNVNEIKSSSLKASLFPNDLYGNVNYLTVHFPGEGQFLLKEIWATLATSVVFIFIIIGCFAYAIYIIIRQKKLSEIKNDFINNMTHELKTPIATVGLACEALHEKEMRQNDQTLLRYLDVISDENKRLADQVEKVLQAAILDRDSFELKKSQFHMNEMVNNILKKVRVPLEARKGRVTVLFQAENDNIYADSDHIANVLINLLDNAIKYTVDRAPLINIATSDNQEGVVVKISDNGPGMRREDLKRIFDKFYRIPTGDRHDVKGFGLGLSYVKSIVTMHGGDISVTSEIDKGSTFTIYLPFQDGE